MSSEETSVDQRSPSPRRTERADNQSVEDLNRTKRWRKGEFVLSKLRHVCSALRCLGSCPLGLGIQIYIIDSPDFPACRGQIMGLFGLLQPPQISNLLHAYNYTYMYTHRHTQLHISYWFCFFLERPNRNSKVHFWYLKNPEDPR